MDSELKKQFRELRKISGWSPAETARRLKCSPPHVSNIENLHKATQPSERLLDDFRDAIQRENHPLKYPEQHERVAASDPPELAEAIDQLREVHEKSPEGFRASTTVIATFYDPSSRARRTSKRVAAAAAAKVKSASPKPRP